MSTATSSRAVAVEGLRRLLFSPSRILAVGALACALALGGRALGQDAVDYADGTEIVETLTVNANSLAITANGKVAYNDILVDGRELTELPVLSFAGDDHVVKGVARILRGGLNTTQSKSVTFDNAFDVADGSEIVLGGAAAFNGVVDVAASKIDASGNVVFKSAFNLNAKSEATLSENVNLDGVVNVNGSKLAAFGNVAFNNALNVNDKTGVATLSGNVKANQAVTVNGGATLNAQGDAKFAKAVVASGKSTLNASGNAQFNGGAVAYGSTIDAKGNAAFNDEVNLKAGSQLNLTGAVDGETVRMNKVVNVDNESKLYSHGNVQYNDDVNLTNGSEARFYQNGDEAITTSFADGVTLTIDASQAFADASHLQVDVDMKGGQLTYGNYGGDVLPDDNKVYVTYDENNDATEITYNNGKAKIDKAFDKGDVVKNKITGNGTLAFGGFDSFSDSLTLKNGYTVVLDSSESSSKEDHFAFSGATDVKKGFVVIEGDTSFGAIDAADDANVVTVTGEFYDKYDNAAVYGNANLYDENGNPIFVKEEAGAQVYFTYDKKGVEVALAVDADGKLAAFDKNGNSLEIKAQDVAVGDLYKVESAGMLGFYRNGVDAALAPTLNANKVNFVGGQAYGEKIGLYGDGDVARGARLWLDAKGTESTYKLGEINANEINFGSDTSIWYDETSTHHENAQKLTFELNAPTVTVGNVQNNADALTNVFDKPLINVEVVGKHLDEQLVGYTVTASAKNLETFARECL